MLTCITLERLDGKPDLIVDCTATHIWHRTNGQTFTTQELNVGMSVESASKEYKFIIKSIEVLNAKK